MAVYNTIDSVKDAVDSILSQTHEDWDLLIIDDHSTDGTFDLLLSIAEVEPKITVLRNPKNLGLAASLNRGWRLARGELIARMDADDISHPQRLAKQVDFMEKHPEVDVLGTGAELIDEEGHSLKLVNMPEKHEDLVKNISKSTPFFHPSVMMRKEFLRITGGYDERLRRKQDYDLWSRSFREFRFHNLKEPLIGYQTEGYRRPLRTIMYGVYVRIRCAYRNGYICKGTCFALLGFIRSLFVKFKIYVPKSIRQD